MLTSRVFTMRAGSSWQQQHRRMRFLPLANRASPTIFDLRRGELVFFRRFPVFFEQNPTLNRKKSFRCAKRASFFFFSGRKKFFLGPKRASPTSSPLMNYRGLSRADTVVGVLCKLFYSPFRRPSGPRIRGVHPVASQPIRRPTRNPDHTRSSFNTSPQACGCSPRPRFGLLNPVMNPPREPCGKPRRHCLCD